MNRYFLAQDRYFNWYCIPEDRRDTFNRLKSKDDNETYDAWDEMEKHIIDINTLTFENPDYFL